MNKPSKQTLIFALILFVAASAFANAATNPMQSTEDFATGAIRIIGIGFIVVLNAIWIIFPAGAGFLTYSYYKKKNEQSAQEDGGLKMAGSILASVVVGFMGAYFLIGSIGMAAGGAANLKDGNAFIVKNFIGKLVTHVGSQI